MLSRRSFILVTFSFVSLFFYLFGTGDQALESLQYFDEESLQVLPVSLPERKYSVFVVGVLVFMDFLVSKNKISLISLPLFLKVYIAFLGCMALSFVFDGGAAISYNLGYFLMVVFLFSMWTCGSKALRPVFIATSFFLVTFLILKLYFYPPHLDLSILRRYGGGGNPNSHAMYSSLTIIFSFLFFDKQRWRLFLFLPFFLLGGFNVALTGSRTSFLGLAFSALIVIWTFFGAKNLWAAFAVLVALIASFYFVLPGDFIANFIARADALEDRASGTFVVPWNAFVDSSLIPYGPSVGAIVMEKYHSPLDSGFLWILLAGGVLPFFLIISVVFLIAKKVNFVHRSISLAAESKNMLGVSIGTLVYLIFFMIFEGGLRHILGWGDFIFLLSSVVLGLHGVETRGTLSVKKRC